MRLRQIALLFALVFGSAASGFSQEPGQLSPLAPNAPKDQPHSLKSENESKFDEAIKPYVEKALKSYPAAKERFLAGLPPKHVFSVTTRLHDSEGRWEQVFIEVKEIKDGVVKGLIANEIDVVSGYHIGDDYTFPESDVLDWTVSRPDGTEEGNFVGKFLDTYKPD